MAIRTDDIFVAKTSAMFRDSDGNMVRIRRGKTTARQGHPILRGREHMFEPLTVTFDVEAKASKPKAAK